MALARRYPPAVLEAHAVLHLVDAVRTALRTGERSALFIVTLYDGTLRVSEALALRPIDLVRADTGCASAYWGASRAWWASAPPWWPISTSTPTVG